MSDISALKQVLKQHRTIAVVGLSADWFRPS
ncbi:MAG: CoA-binding protein, partial [Limnohabitans sp.]|nr:CoA-binding protein [Limnohabitans sp.]